MYATTTSCSIAMAAIILMLVLIRKNIPALLKDNSAKLTVDQSPYSLSRTLFFYWTVIITLSFCYIGIIDDDITTIDKGVLILMGIVAGTATAARAIDSTQIHDPSIDTRPQDMPSEGFLSDILTDGNGLSISRLQTVIFNIIYSLIFISIVISQHVLYNFPADALTLMGISSSAYALLKIPETNTVKNAKV